MEPWAFLSIYIILIPSKSNPKTMFGKLNLHVKPQALIVIAVGFYYDKLLAKIGHTSARTGFSHELKARCTQKIYRMKSVFHPKIYQSQMS